jgi:hypothetical protein
MPLVENKEAFVRELTILILAIAPMAGCERLRARGVDEPRTLAIVSGNQQGDSLGHPLPQPLTVAVFDTRGSPVRGARVAWAVTAGSGAVSSDTTASEASGLSRVRFMLGATPGTDSVRATLVGTTEAVAFAVVAGRVAGPWPNEAQGFTTVTDWAYNQLVSPKKRHSARGPGTWNERSGTGRAEIVRDSSAPLSGPNVAQITYPAGLLSGTEPWTLYLNPAQPGREYYTAFWWKASAPWQGDPSGINKISFWQDGAPSCANLIVMMNNQNQAAYLLTVTLEFNAAMNGHLGNAWGSGTVWHTAGNVSGGNYVITPGTWYRIELYFKGSTTPTSRDGVLRYWVAKQGDTGATPVGDYTNVNFDTANFVQFSFAPTWGGNSGVRKRAPDYYWVDHVHISRP